jgi:hypothetical protein
MIKLSDLEFALDFVSGGEMFMAEAYVSIKGDEVLLLSDYDDATPVPEDITNEKKYIPLPSKQELGLGRNLVLEFAAHYLADDYEDVVEIFRKTGAYARYKDLLEQRNMLDKWYEYENRQVKKMLLNWCTENEINISG